MSFTIRHAWLAAVAAAVVVLPAPAPARIVSRALPCVPDVTCPKPNRPCPNADLQPDTGNLTEIRHATLCLLNAQRTRHKLEQLRENPALRGVAVRYARSMVALSFFSHVSPTGSTFVDRIKQSTYLDGANGYELGENLAWGAGSLSTPRRIVRAWMNSPGHRANILNGDFRDIGLGTAAGIPLVGGGPGGTYVNEFGHRG